MFFRIEHNAPVEVQTYLREASKCFIYGQFIACLIVCRSAIDFALRECLSRGGRKRDLERFRLEKKDTFENVLSLARESFSWKLLICIRATVVPAKTRTI